MSAKIICIIVAAIATVAFMVIIGKIAESKEGEKPKE